MPKINIDELCEPIEVTVGGKTYSVTDISRETAKKMGKLSSNADDPEKPGDPGDTEDLVEIMTEVLAADRKDIAALGMRKLLMLVSQVMSTINDEVVAKKRPRGRSEVEATIAAAFPGMFTWFELFGMGIRQKGYWLGQADAIKRQRIAEIAHGVGIGMADSEDGQRAMDELELTKTSSESREQRSSTTWDMIMALGGGKGV